MYEVLLLLLMFSLATLFSRQTLLARVLTIGATPILIFIGYLLSPSVLSVFLPSTIESFEPALRMALLWTCFLIGLRFGHINWRRDDMVRSWYTFLYGGFAFAFCFFCSYFILRGLSHYEFLPKTSISQPKEFIALSLIFAGLFSASSSFIAKQSVTSSTRVSQIIRFIANHDDIISVIGICFGIAIWPHSLVEGTTKSSLPAGVLPLLVGAGLALAVRLIIDSTVQKGTATRLALVGLATLGAGWAVGVGVQEALVGFFFGFILDQLYSKTVVLDSYLQATERPVRLVICILAGAYLKFSLPAVLLGAFLTVARLAVKTVIKIWLARQNEGKIPPVTALTGFSGAALPLALSFVLTPPALMDTNFILVAVAVAYALNDTLTLILWSRQPVETDLPIEVPGDEKVLDG